MPTVKFDFVVSFGHDIGEEEVCRRIKARAEEIRAEYAKSVSGLWEQWNRSTAAVSFSAMESAVMVDLVVGPRSVELRVRIKCPSTLSQREIESFIAERVGTLFIAQQALTPSP